MILPLLPQMSSKHGVLTLGTLLEQTRTRLAHVLRLPKELSIHSARHTIAVQLLKKTGNLRLVQKQLGHASPATTANMYADISFEDMQNGVLTPQSLNLIK